MVLQRVGKHFLETHITMYDHGIGSKGWTCLGAPVGLYYRVPEESKRVTPTSRDSTCTGRSKCPYTFSKSFRGSSLSTEPKKQWDNKRGREEKSKGVRQRHKSCERWLTKTVYGGFFSEKRDHLHTLSILLLLRH